MTNRIQTLRSSVAGNVPTSGTRQPGELWLNFPDKQIGYIDQSQVAQKLQAVRFFSTLANYAVGDCVWNAGVLYSASVAVVPGAFNPLQWTLIGGAGTGFLPLSGGTLTGPLALSSGNLAVNAGNISASGSATFGSITTAGTLNATGTVTTGALNATGNLYASGTITAGANLVANNGVLATHGTTSAYYCYDRGNAGGNTAQAFMLYRDGNSGRLDMTEVGDVLSFNNTNGAATFINAVGCTGLTVNGDTTANGQVFARGGMGAFLAYDRAGSGQYIGLYRDSGGSHLATSDASVIGINSPLSVSGAMTVYAPSTLTGAVGINSAANFPLQINANAGVYPGVISGTAGQYQWIVGAWPDGSCYIWNNSTAKPGAYFDTVCNAWLCNGNGSQVISGATGAWDISGKMVISPAGSGAGAGGAISAYGGVSLSTNYRSRVDTTGAYLMYSMYGGTAVGWITTDGGNTYYGTACDAKLKENIRPLAVEVDVGSIIDRLNPVAFEWLPRSFKTPDQIEFVEGIATLDENSPADAMEKAKRVTPGREVRFDGMTSYGFIAQELYQVVPHLVQKPIEPEKGRTRPEGVGDTWGADITHLVPYLVAELQLLRKRVAQLEGRV